MVQFAVFADLQNRTPVTLDTAQTTYFNTLLADASTVVRRYCHGNLFVTTQTTEIIRPTGGKIKLPKRPVVSVQSVFVIDYLQNDIPVVGPFWDGNDEIWLLYGQTVLNLAEGLRELFQYNTPSCKVTYTYGYATVPDEVVAVVCSMVQRRTGVPSGGAVQSQTTGPFSVTLTPAAAAGPMAMTKDEKDMLAEYRRSVHTLELR